MNSFDRIHENYEMFITHQQTCQSNMISIMSECVALESGSLESLRAINESAVDKVKEILKMIMDKIKGVIAKFISKVNAVCLSDISYLEKYKDTIAKNPFKDRDITMYQYNISMVDNDFGVPAYDFDSFKEIATSDNIEGAFISKYLAKSGIDPKDDDIKGQIMTKFRGGDEPKEMNMKALDKAAMFAFCINYKKNIEAIEKDQKVLETAQSALSREIEKYSMELKSDVAKSAEIQKQEQADKEKNDAAKSNEPATDPKVKVQGESALIYSSVLESFVLIKEEKGSATVSISKASNGKKAVPGTSTVDTGMKTVNLNADVAKSDVDNLKAGHALDDNASTGEKSKELEELQSGLTKYFTCMGNMIMAKMTILSEIQKAYMKILRIHVSDYVSASNGTDTPGTAPDTAYNTKVKIGDVDYVFKYEPGYKNTGVVKQGYFKGLANKIFQTGKDAVDDDIAATADKFVNAVKIDKATNVILNVSGGGNSYFIRNINGKWSKCQLLQDSEAKQAEKILNQGNENTTEEVK